MASERDAPAEPDWWLSLAASIEKTIACPHPQAALDDCMESGRRPSNPARELPAGPSATSCRVSLASPRSSSGEGRAAPNPLLLRSTWERYSHEGRLR